MSKSEITLLDSEYFPCIAWYRVFLQAASVCIEQYEHYERTTFRNRCEVSGPNGKIVLSVPLERGRNQRTVMKDIRVCNREKWQSLHWKTLCASYRRAPYFEYYEEHFIRFFETPFTFLLDVNHESLALLQTLLKTDKQHALTTSYTKQPDETVDWRQRFTPLSRVEDLPAYMQNFEERHGFLSNLSMLDMLFSCGHRATTLLQQSAVS